MKKLVAITAMISLLQGCASTFNPAGSSEFACPGMPSGVTCKNPREVYKMTDSPRASGNGTAAGQVPTYIYSGNLGNQQLNPVPVLEQAQVMRVWIAPWVDKNKDLHWPGLMFTEVRPRQWNFGENSFDGVEPPVPHMMYEVAKAKVPANMPEATASTSSAPMPINEAPVN